MLARQEGDGRQPRVLPWGALPDCVGGAPKDIDPVVTQNMRKCELQDCRGEALLGKGSLQGHS